MVTRADGYAERDPALLMLEQKQRRRSRRIPVGTGKAYDNGGFRRYHARNECNSTLTRSEAPRKSSLDRKTTRQPGYTVQKVTVIAN
jgi:hypothetical protein